MQFDSKTRHLLCILFVVLSLPIYVYMAHEIDRVEFDQLLLCYSILFLLYLSFLGFVREKNIPLIIMAALILRLAFLFSEPFLSDDIWRFIWDGRLWNAGINPFEKLPVWYINNDIHIAGINEELYLKLNSPNYFTIYPPFNQLLFWLSTKFAVDNVWISIELLRLSIITAEIGVLFLLLKLFELNNIPESRIGLYAFNPLVIIELSGNLHFEAWLIFFLLISIYFLQKQKTILSAIFFTLAICTKLWPLMFLPLLIGKLDGKVLIKFYSWVIIFTLSVFALSFDWELTQNLFSSIDLYFRKFEFNASIFYLGRFIGFQYLTYDPIKYLGPALGFITFVAIMFFAWRDRNNSVREFPRAIFHVFFIYLSFATTVHPWYVIIVLAFSLFSNLRFPILWSFLVFLSYYTYSQPGWKESTFILILEYGLLWLYLLIEIRNSGQIREQLAKYIP